MNFALASIQPMALAFASSLWRPADVRSTHGRHSVCGLHYRSTVSLTSETVLQHFGGNIALPLSLSFSLFLFVVAAMAMIVLFVTAMVIL